VRGINVMIQSAPLSRELTVAIRSFLRQPLTLAAAAVSVLWLYLWLYFRKVHSNASSKTDRQRIRAIAILSALTLLGPLCQTITLQTPLQILALVIATIALSVLTAELVRYTAKSQYKPAASLLYVALSKRPYFVRYWPAWALADSVMVLNQTAIVEFRLVESSFDLNLVMLSPTVPLKPQAVSSAAARDLDDSAKERVLDSTISFPFDRYDERAMTESGVLRTDKTIELVCEAPDFDPPRTSLKTTVEALAMNSVSIPLLPKSAGRRQIIFHLLDSGGAVVGSMRLECAVASNRSKLLALPVKITLALAPLAGIVRSIFFLVEKMRGLLGW
jgi:hypothetical protein